MKDLPVLIKIVLNAQKWFLIANPVMVVIVINANKDTFLANGHINV